MLLITSFFLLISSCSKMPPECSDPDSLKALKAVISKILLENSGFQRIALTPDRFNTLDPHTISIDEKVHSRSCQVDVTYRISASALDLLSSSATDPRIPAVLEGILIDLDQSRGSSLLRELGGGKLPMEFLTLLSGDKWLESIKKIGQSKSLQLNSLPYKIRRSEDQSSLHGFVVETALPTDWILKFKLVEAFSEYAQSAEPTVGIDNRRGISESQNEELVTMDSPSGTSASSSPTRPEWENLLFRDSLRAKLPNSDENYTITADDTLKNVIYLDLDGDGIEEVLVRYTYESKSGNWGGSGLAVYKVGEDGTIARWGKGIIGESTFGGSTFIDYSSIQRLPDGRIYFSTEVKQDSDPSCCPSGQGYRIYKVTKAGDWHLLRDVVGRSQ